MMKQRLEVLRIRAGLSHAELAHRLAPGRSLRSSTRAEKEVDIALRILSFAQEIEGGVDLVLGGGEPTDEELRTMWNDLSNPTWPGRGRGDPKIEREPHGPRSSRSPKSKGKDTPQKA